MGNQPLPNLVNPVSWNLSLIQRIAVAEKYRPIYEKQAKENHSVFKGNQYTVSLVNLPKEQTVNTSEKLASIAGVSEKTYRIGAKVLQKEATRGTGCKEITEFYFRLK